MKQKSKNPKIVRIGAEKRKIFFMPIGQGDKWTIRRLRISATKHKAFEALSSLDFVYMQLYGKLRQTPEEKKTKNDELKLSGKQARVSIFSLFYSRKVTFFFVARFYPSIQMHSTAYCVHCTSRRTSHFRWSRPSIRVHKSNARACDACIRPDFSSSHASSSYQAAATSLGFISL